MRERESREREEKCTQIRAFVDKEVIPNVEEWEQGNDTIPMDVYKKVFLLRAFGIPMQTSDT